MATTGHCAYCFEVLAADLENREALSYHQVQDLWSEYQSLDKPTAGEAAEQDDEEDGTSEDDPNVEESSETDELDSQDDPEGELAGMQEQASTSMAATLQLPSISRLQAPSPSTPSSSSSSLTPSSLSTNSSQAALNTNSKTSSNSSFFSFNRSKQPSPAAPPPLPKEEAHPLFVTWNTISSRGHKSLRGCIGTFDAQDLPIGLKSYALTAAFDDTRFPPISPSELPRLSNSTTLLTNFTPAQHPLDWTLGKHGIRIAFTHHNKRYGATYLPDVAVEQGWTKEETLVSLMRKAGCSGSKVKGWRDLKGGMEVVRYEGVKQSVRWEEWRRWREWVRGLGVR